MSCGRYSSCTYLLNYLSPMDSGAHTRLTSKYGRLVNRYQKRLDIHPALLHVVCI
jgi:hypothetical protein